jgi:hypothetical protein
MIKFIPDKPALMIGGREKLLIIADLHLGIVNFPERSVIKESANLVRDFDPDGVLILGDVKHDIGMRVKERKEVELLKNELLKSGVDEDNIILIRGNHDGGIDDIIRCESSRGIVIGKYGLFHGHAHPSDEVLQKKYLIFAHIHPAVYIEDVVGGIKKRVWLESEFYLDGESKRVVVMPAFNELCSSIALNVEKNKLPFRKRKEKIWDLRNAKAILLDGIVLGKVSDI